jgi:ABC-type multidrug transport system fused ATPase/permease subunit
MYSKKETTLSLFKKLIPHVGKRKILNILLIQILSLFSSLVEAASVGAIIPFIALIGSPEKVINSQKIKPFIQSLNISTNKVTYYITFLFILLVIFSAFLKWILIFLNTRLSNSIGSLLAYNLYKRTLYQPYIIHTSRNSSEIISGVTRANELVISVILPFFLMFNAIFTIILLFSVLIYLNPFIIITSFFGIGIFYFLVMKIVKRKILHESALMNSRRPLLFKILQEGLGGIRDILIDGTQGYYSDLYYLNEKKFKESQAKVTLINNTPNIAIQSFGISLIAFFAGYVATNGDMNSTLPFLGALAFGYLRISPALQQVFTSWTSLKSGQASFSYVIDFLSEPLPIYADKIPEDPIVFKDKIELNNIDFKYSQELPYVFEKLSLTINKGSRVGFIGTTGSGKSTLIDIIMCLIEPTNGYVKIDNNIISNKNFRSWQINIAHVPQSIYLSDNTVLENIAFGIPINKIDYIRAENAAKKAQIFDTIDSWEHKFQTQIGERGIRLSGGQRQRIGIARALYKNANVIIFDEATSALDGETEADVMKSIELLGSELTILIIAHRITTLKNCDCIFELDKGRLIKHTSIDFLINSQNNN